MRSKSLPISSTISSPVCPALLKTFPFCEPLAVGAILERFPSELIPRNPVCVTFMNTYAQGEREEKEERDKPDLHTDLTTSAAITLYRSIVGSVIRIFVKVGSQSTHGGRQSSPRSRTKSKVCRRQTTRSLTTTQKPCYGVGAIDPKKVTICPAKLDRLPNL